MNTPRREQIKNVAAKLEKDDLKYAEDTVKEAYRGEIDRKDKILTSMSVITAPVTILFAGVAFLTNNALDQGQGIMTLDPDFALMLFYVAFSAMAWKLIAIVHNFNKLLAGENYHYLANANDLLDGIIKNKEYCLANNIKADGEASRFAKIDTIIQLAESSTRNCNANDVRLGYRQKIFSGTIIAITCAAVGFIAVASHREWPNMWSLSRLWRGSDGKQSQNTSTTTTSSIPTLGSAQTTPSDQPAVAAPPATGTPTRHQ